MKSRMIQFNVIVVLLLLLQHTAAKTITQHETIDDPNGNKITRTQSWSTSQTLESNDYPKHVINANIDTDSQLKVAAAAKGMDPLAIDELLRTNETIVRNFTDDRGYLHTTNYTRTPDGGITSHTHIEKTISSIPLSEEKLVPGVGPFPILDQPINPINTQTSNRYPYTWRYRPTLSSTPELERAPTDTAAAYDVNKDVEVFTPRRTTTWAHPSVFDNPTYNWPAVSPFDFNNRRSNPDVFTTTTTNDDDDGNTVTTKWTKKTYTFPTMPRLIPTTYDSYFTTTSTLRPTNTGFTSTTLKPTKTFNIDDFPVTNILKNPSQFPDTLRPVSQDEFTSTKTIKVDNIPMTDDGLPQTSQLSPEVQDALQKAGITPDEIRNSNGAPIVRTRVEPDGKIVRTTFSVKNIPTISHGDRPFTDFKPTNYPSHSFDDDFNSLNNWFRNTSYRPAPMPTIPTIPITTSTTPKPQIFDETIEFPVSWRWKLMPQLSPTVRDQLQRSGISNDEIQEAYTKPIVKTRLDANGKIVRTTYKLRDMTRPTGNIADFLLRVDLHPDDILLRNGHGITKTIIDDDGRILTANFILSTPLAGASGNGSGSGTGLAEKNVMKPWK